MPDKDFMYRMGLADKPAYWDEKIRQLPRTEAFVPQAQRLRPQNNVDIVAQGPLGSIQELLSGYLSSVLATIVDRVPAQFKRDGVTYENPPGLIVTATLQGTQIDIVPATVRIQLSIEPATLKELTAVVSFEDGTYDPRDYHNDAETFRVDWVSPMEDLVGLVTRYINSRRKGVGA